MHHARTITPCLYVRVCAIAVHHNTAQHVTHNQHTTPYYLMFPHQSGTHHPHHSEAARQELDSFDGLSVGLRQTGRGIATRYNIAAAGLRAASLVREILFLAASVMQLLVTTEFKSLHLMLYPDESSISLSQ